jgi:hypothetical protein|nr:MAG TPA: hypothetical protein [Caudoviricetes sp.]
MKFKVGDKVKGISNTYGITNTNMYLGEVKKVGDDYIEILILKHKNPRCIGDIYTVLSPEGKFEIVDNLTISQLQSEIDKLSNKVQEEYSNVISNRDKVNYLKKQLKQLKEENKKEKNKPILDDVEKEYLSAVIRPFKNRISDIVKRNFDSEKSYIVIHINSESFYFPYFKKGTMYEGMEADKKYTLKELCLDE